MYAARRTPAVQRYYRYGITDDQFKAMTSRFSGLCWVCRERLGTMVDHCHDTKRVRGLLCHGCNTAIGKLGDTSTGLRRALAYLESSEQSLTE